MATDLNHLDQLESHSGAAFFVKLLENYGFLALFNTDVSNEPPKLLVIGSGTGHEAAYLQQRLRAEVEAIDIDVQPDPEFRNVDGLRFHKASALELPFSSKSFDAVFYHHVIEHVADPPRSLVEVDRVMRDQAWLFVGTPNRHRLVSSVGAHKQATWEPSLKNKFKDNLQDWRARLTGTFKNHLGAHAGFSRGELDALLFTHFSVRHWVTKDYLGFKYDDHALKHLVNLATTGPLRWFTAPSIYAMCQR